jgi:hypothetical protein
MDDVESGKYLPRLPRQRDEPRGSGKNVQMMDNVSVVMLTCDRPEMWQTIESIENRLHGPIVQRLLLVDGGKPDRINELRNRLDPVWSVLSLSQSIQGFGPSMRRATAIAASMDTEWLMWFEDDFRLMEDIDLADLAQIIEHDSSVAQVCFKRQPVWPGEIAAGTIFCGDDFQQCDGYVRSSHYWTCNPSLMPMWVYRDNPWPDGDDSEKAFGDALYPKGYYTATYGKLADPPRIEHLGGERTNVGY